MDRKISLLKRILLIRVAVVAAALPTLGHVDRNRLETYEDLAEDLDLFGNLTFRFSCESRPIGLYADLDYNCRIFHACDDSGSGFPVICPNDTFFDQRERVCTDDENADCERAIEWFYLNELPYSVEVTEENGPTSVENEEIPSVAPLVSL